MTTRRGSGLRSRIVWSTAALSAVATAVMAAAVLLIASRLTAGRVDAGLEDGVTTAEATVQVRPDGSLTAAPDAADQVSDSVWVFDRDGRQVIGPEAGERVRETVRRLSAVTARIRTESHDRAYLAEPFHAGPAGRRVGVVVASERLAPYESTRDILVGGLVGLGALVTAGSAAVTAWTVGRTLAPVRRMTDLATEWSERDLDSRFAPGPGTDELTELGHTLDALLDRVARAIRTEQRLTAELAHELRTPLTTIRAEAELGSADSVDAGDAGSADRFDRVVAQADRLDRTIGTLLAVARHEQGTEQRTDVPALLEHLVLARGAPTPVSVQVEDPAGGPAEAAVPPELVERVVEPVLDNALRYARSQVRLVVRPAADEVVVDVCDDGPGLEQARPDTVFEAGVRSAGSAGAGLGLALARRVARGVGGSVEVHSAHTPTTVRIRLPTR